MRYHIRLMRQEDAIQMAEISLEAFPCTQVPTNYQREFRNPLAHYIVAFDSSEGENDTVSNLPRYMVGYAGFWLIAGEAHIVDIAVRNAYKSRGIGELLLISLIGLALALNASQATLEVRASNHIACSLYRKYGFSVQGVRKRYYLDNNEDAVIMTVNDISSKIYKSFFEKLKQEHSARWGFKLYPLAR